MAVIRQIFILCIAVAVVRCHSLPHPPPFDHPGIPGHPPYRNIFTDFVQNLANGLLGGFLGNRHGNGNRPGGYNFPPNTRPGYGEYYDNGVNNAGVNMPGQSFGINDHGGPPFPPQQGGFNVNENSYNTGIGQEGNNEKVPETNTAASVRPQKPDVNGEKEKGDAPVNNYFIVVPLNTNGIKPQPQPQGESNSNINGASTNDVSNNAGGENVNGNVNGNAIVDAQVTNPQNNPEQQKEDANKQLDSDPDLKYNVNTPQEPKVPNQIEGNENNKEQNIKDESTENEKQGPGFDDETTNKGTLIVDPEVKYNTNKPDESKMTSPDTGNMIENRVPSYNDEDIKKGISLTDPESKHSGADELDKFRNPDAIVFPSEGTEIIIENLPNRFSNAESTNQPSNNVQVTQPTPASNNAVIQNQNQNQQVPANNGNAPYVNGAGSSNSAYTVVNPPTGSGSSGSSNGNAGVSSTGQTNSPYVNAVGNPNGYTVMNVPNNAGNSGQSYVVPNNGNSGQGYVVPNNGNSGQGYVVPSNANSGTKNPPVVYVLSNGNSGVRNPGQSYVSTNYGTNYPSQSYGYDDMNKPTQVYIPYNGNTGGNSNQIYVLGNPGDYNGQSTSGAFTPRPIYVTIPGYVAQTTNGEYYKPIFVPANNGPISVPVTYKPVVSVPVGPGYQVVGSNPGVMVSYQTPGNVMTSGGSTPPPNVPLLISYKDDEKDEDEKKKAGKRKPKQSVEEDRDMDEFHHDHDDSH